MARLFVAVWPPAEVLRQVASLARPAVAGLRWTEPEQWHVTLRFLGRVADEDVPAVRSSLSAGLAGQPPVEAAVGPAVGRFGQRVLHVPVTGLAGLAGTVVEATAGLGEPPEDRPFAGHLTLARARGGPGRGRSGGHDGAEGDLRTFVGSPVGGTWTVDEVALVESRLSAAGARYEIVERYPLMRPASSG